ncbi:urea ABC transporter substrate-binding protein [Actinoplanes lobatus]|uniref:Urea transport system substrate-binding protein n=2 Tax=Actinoplanes TaxID=1865 RepID=A0A7W5FIW3_9ACTN|nr:MULTISPECIES: urea ABC transporter substrate-binding protein [Actinoplanes]MBB3100089.1 urea transport system substrate-binding protein [Actinoplanes campanulatus]MBB4749215.1 urea transport system substrate-binding protein [Actinoplanes lobatus]GGN29009.1 urea ABC transporter substrate-binding protein [Actinoplanes campanulatus]GGN80286.1 urea ABC transporter substrate-binding protein [Actinoplanes lobatus]GID38958.1 urea ABC transporter substrate-binding protein [Actinoplanes campanulatus
MSTTSKRLRTLMATGAIGTSMALVLAGCGAKAGEETAASAASPAASCVDTSGSTVKLGFLNSLTGGMAISEKTVSNVLHMAADEINAAGGILGKKIEYIQEDGATDWPTFAEKTEKLLTQDCVAAIFGGWTSSSRKAVKPVVEKNNGLFFYPVQYEGLESSPNIYYTGATTNQQIIPAMDFLASQGVKKLFLAGSDYVFPRTANAIIKLYAAKLGIEIVGEEYVPLDKDDWTSQVAKIVAAKPDFIFNTINGSSNVGFIKAYYDAGLTAATTPIISVSIAEEEAPAMGHEVSGQYASWNYFQSLKTETNPKFIESWKAYPSSSGVTSDPMEAAYISMYLYKALVEAAGSFDVDAVNAAAKKNTITFDAPEGKVTLDGENHHISKPGHIGKINSSNQFDIVWASDKFIEPDPYLEGYDWFPADIRKQLVDAAG